MKTDRQGSISGLGASIILELQDSSASALLKVSGSRSGTLAVQARIDDTWYTLGVAKDGSVTSYIANNGLYRMNVAGYSYVRVVPTSWTSGTANVVLSLSQAQVSDIANRVVVDSVINEIRDSFATFDPTMWDISVSAGESAPMIGGDAGAASYLRFIKNGLTKGTTITMLSKQTFTLPSQIRAGLSINSRVGGLEHRFEMVAVDDNGNVEQFSAKPDIAISGNISVSSTIWTINTATPHGLVGTDKVLLSGNTDSRLNVGPIAITSIISPTQFTITSSLLNAGTYTAGGAVKVVDHFDNTKNVAGYIFENSSSTTVTVATRGATQSTQQTPSVTTPSTNPTARSAAGFTDALVATALFDIVGKTEELLFRTIAADTVNASSATTKYTQGLPDVAKKYKIRIVQRSFDNFCIPVAKITTASKTGTTTATIVAPNHGLTTSDYVLVYGVRDQTNFPNLSTATVVSSVIDADTFTIPIGTATTSGSIGGAVFKINGGNNPNLGNFAVQSISRTNNILTVVFNATFTGATVGEHVTLYGLDGAAAAYEGVYKVAAISTTNLLLYAPGPDFGNITCGGVAIRNAEYKLHFLFTKDYEINKAEIVGGVGKSDYNDAVPVTGSLLTVSSVSTVATVTTGNIQSIVTNSAVYASAAVTSSGNETTLNRSNNNSVQIIINTTAVSGTNPTLDYVLQESADSGTTWKDVYHFPRITAVSTIVSPILPLGGNNWRLVRVGVGGTSPSFTRVVTANYQQTPGTPVRSFYDRSIVPNTLNSTTAGTGFNSWNIEGCKSVSAYLSMGAQTGAPTLTLQVSDDGANWADTPVTLTGVANSTVVSSGTVNARFARLRVSTAGTAATLGYVHLLAQQ